MNIKDMENIKSASETTSKIICLLFLTKDNLMQASELGKKLNCTTRQIYRLMRGIKKAGINVETKRGRYGGYIIKDDRYEISEELYLSMMKKTLKDEK